MDYSAIAADELYDELVTDEYGALSDAFDGSLYEQLRALGRALATNKANADDAIAEWQAAVAVWAAGRMDQDLINQRAADIEEDERTAAQELMERV